MGWWWVALMLVLVPRHHGNPGLWLGVALVLSLPGVHPCLVCFMPPLQRAQLCYDITGVSVNNPKNRQCRDTLVEASKSLSSVTVGSEQREELRDIIMDAAYYLEEQKDKKPLNKSLQEAIKTIWAKVSRLEKAPSCIPPCGFQLAARVFRCSACRFVDCEFPLDCPVQDTWTYTDETIVLHCDVPFTIPSGQPITWMFAPNLRTQDLTLFKELKGNPEKPFSLIVEQPAPGTVACRLGEFSNPIVRKFFYLNVSEGSVEEEKGLQSVFNTVLHWLQNETTLPQVPTMGVAVAVASTVLVLLLVVGIWHFVFVRRTSHEHEQQGTLEDSRSLDSTLEP